MDDAETADLMAQLTEMRAEIANYKQNVRRIRNMCDAPHFDSKRRWAIRDLCNVLLKTPHGE